MPTPPKRPPGRPRKSPPKEPGYTRPRKSEDLVIVRACLSPVEADKIKAAAKARKDSISGLIRSFIATLPEPQEPE